ncbi:MAG: 3-oxoacid CoA-transferase subunit A [Negativicutes bacterium]|jgi:acetate CoA/acetoacetate CoA-transferase alpha subunit
MQVINVQQAAEYIHDGMTVMVAGFLSSGTAETIIDAVVCAKCTDLTIIANDTAFVDKGVGKLIVAKLVKKVITSHIGTNKATQQQYLANELEVELVPQGTLAERIRAGGVGLGGILTPTGVGTLVEQGKQVVEIDGKKFLLEKPLKADVAILKAKRADYQGNLQYGYTTRNFNPLMAMAAETVIVEVDEIVPVGAFAPDDVHTISNFIDYVVVKGQ